MTFGISVETNQLVGNESVDHRQWCAHEVECGIEVSVATVVIHSAQHTNLIVIARDSRLYPMTVFSILQINKLAAEITHRHSLIGKIAHLHVGDNRNLSVGILHQVEVSIHHARYQRHERHYRSNLFEIETVDADSEILKHCRVSIITIHLHTSAVVGNKVNLGSKPVVASKEYEVVVVETEFLISDERFVGSEMHIDATVEHLGHHPHIESLFIILIVELSVGSHFVSVEITINNRLEDELRITLVVLRKQSEIDAR